MPTTYAPASAPSTPADPSTSPIVIPHAGGELFDRNGFGVHWKIDGHQAGSRFSVVHHPMAPRILAAPLHRHHREDEYSYVLTGTLGALLGNDVVTAGPGTWVFKPRNQWHTFWNAGDTPCEIIEIISPAGFEDFFRGLKSTWPDMGRLKALADQYELDIDPGSVPSLCERFGVRM